jgi:hypothetical protein
MRTIVAMIFVAMSGGDSDFSFMRSLYSILPIVARAHFAVSPTNKQKTKKPTPPPTPKASHPWDSPPLPRSGDSEPDFTFRGVGLSLSQWEYFEGYLGLLYGLLIGANDQASPGMRAYGAVAGFNTRLDMLKEATNAFFFILKKDVPSEYFQGV